MRWSSMQEWTAERGAARILALIRRRYAHARRCPKPSAGSCENAAFVIAFTCMPLSNPTARPGVAQLRPSRIREVANAAMGRQDLIAFWFGEPDEVTPAFIRQAAIESLQAGETFYSQNLGLPELREAIAAYLTRLHRPTAVERVAVTSSGL